MKEIRLKYDHVAERRPEYPSPSEQLDAIYKGFRAIRDAGITLPPETLEWLAEIEAVKAKFPKS